MFCLPHRRSFFTRIQLFLVSIITRRVSSQTITRQRKASKFVPRGINKSPKLMAKKLNVESKVYKRDIITNIYNILRYSTWDTAQEQLENLSIKWDSFIVNQVLKTHPPMQKAWLFFIWASRRKNFKHDQYTYTTMLDIFGEARRIQSMKFVFEQMKDKGINTDVVTYTSLMHWMSKNGDVDGAVNLWKEMREKRCRPTVVSYTAYMKILFDYERVDEATAIYKEMLEIGLSPNCHTYTVLMEYLACCGKFKDAMEIFEKMQEASVLPDKATCNILIEICCQTGEIWVMMKILKYMKENRLVLRYPVYQKVLETFNVAGESDMLLRQVNRHICVENFNNEDTRRYDKFPSENDSIADTELVCSLINKQNFVALDSLLTAMMSKDIRLETNVVSHIIEVHSTHGRLNNALLAYEYCLKLGMNIDRTAYLALIGLSIRTNSFVMVVEIITEMVKHGLSLGAHLNSLLIFRLGCNKESASAAKVFNLLPDEEKSIAEYTALIAAYFSSGNADTGLEVFKHMKNKGVNVALGTYCVLVNGLEKCGRIREIEYYRKERKRMQTYRCSQDVSMEERICNLLFSGDLLIRHAT